MEGQVQVRGAGGDWPAWISQPAARIRHIQAPQWLLRRLSLAHCPPASLLPCLPAPLSTCPSPWPLPHCPRDAVILSGMASWGAMNWGGVVIEKKSMVVVKVHLRPYLAPFWPLSDPYIV